MTSARKNNDRGTKVYLFLAERAPQPEIVGEKKNNTPSFCLHDFRHVPRQRDFLSGGYSFFRRETPGLSATSAPV